jgi:hypothetical protein
MTAQDVLKKGVTFSKGRTPEQSAWKASYSTERFNLIPWTLEARKLGLRSAARRFRARGKGRV